MSTPAAELDTAKVAAARLWATTRLPYLASAFFACTVHAAPDSGTVGIERGWRISADPRIVGRLSVEQLGRLLLHLTAHAIRDHATRAERVGVAADDARGRWNRATDAEINDDLEPARCVPRVARDLPADLGCEPGQLAEHYYERGREGRRRWDCGPGADGRPSPGGDGLNAEQAASSGSGSPPRSSGAPAANRARSPRAGCAGPKASFLPAPTGGGYSPPRSVPRSPPSPATPTTPTAARPAALTSCPT